RSGERSKAVMVGFIETLRVIASGMREPVQAPLKPRRRRQDHVQRGHQWSPEVSVLRCQAPLSLREAERTCSASLPLSASRQERTLAKMLKRPVADLPSVLVHGPMCEQSAQIGWMKALAIHS